MNRAIFASVAGSCHEGELAPLHADEPPRQRNYSTDCPCGDLLPVAPAAYLGMIEEITSPSLMK